MQLSMDIQIVEQPLTGLFIVYSLAPPNSIWFIFEYNQTLGNPVLVPYRPPSLHVMYKEEKHIKSIPNDQV